MWPFSFKQLAPLTKSEIKSLDLRFKKAADKPPGSIIKLTEREANFVFRNGAYKKSTPTRQYQAGWHAYNQSTALKSLCKV